MPSDFTASLSPDYPFTHTTPTLVPFLCRTARMDVHVPPAMLHGLSSNIEEVAAMSDSVLRKRVRSSYESSASSSSPDLLLWKRSQGTYELVEDEEEEDDEEEDKEDEEVEESLDSDSESEDAEDEGPTTGDQGLAAEDKGPAVRDEGLAAGDEGLASVVETAIGEPLGLGYKALRCREIASREGQMPNVFQIVEERRAHLDMAEIIDSKRKGREPRGDV
nr:hypothetical protein [Tanacetum cinerariifolium]